MIRARIDRWFARFRQHGDPRLLAKVFDQVAPELWRVAAHLCRDRHDAEDAVQSTFLAAIESKDAWDGERPLLPWLVGLLVNRVREQRRARARVVDGARLDVREAVDPATAAGERELGASFAAALCHVSEPFRSVVEQHFVHGLAAAEIAAATGVPAATVRTRLHRGLEQLRQKLPAGAVMGSLVPLRMPAESFASVREVVLAKVPGGGAAAVGSGAVVVSWFGVLAMHKVLFGVAVACVGLAVWWVAEPSLGRRADAVSDGVVAAEAAVTNQSTAPAASGAALATKENEPLVGERIEAPAPDAAGTLSLLVRNGATKAPLANVQVRLTREVEQVHSATNEHGMPVPVAMSAATAADAPEAADGRTDEAGRVALRIAAGRVRLQVAAGLPSPGELLTVVPATTTEHVCDVPPAFTADVLVVDAGGAPVADAAILGADEKDAATTKELGRTDREGRWRAECTETRLSVRAVRNGRIASSFVDLPGKQLPVVLQLGGEAATIHGLVLDAAGAPVPAALIVLVADDTIGRPPAPIILRTDSQGRYRCEWLAPGGYDLLVSDRRARDPRLLLAHATAVLGTVSPTDLQFDEGATLVVRLRRHDGQPLINHSVSLQRKASEIPASLARWSYFGGMTDADGMFTFRGLLPGHYLLTARPFEATLRRELELHDGERSVFEHTFGELRTLQIEVVDEHARPRPGVLVTLHVQDEQGRTTDEKGRVWFEGLERGDYEVSLSRTARVITRSRHTVSTNQPTKLVMPTVVESGRVVGRVVMPRGPLPKGLKLSLYRDIKENPFRPQAVEVILDTTSGTFLCEELPAGHYHFSAVTMEPFANLAQIANIEVPATGTADLGTIELGSGEIQVDVRMTGGDPGKVHAAVRLPGMDFFAGEPRQASTERPIRRQHLSAGTYGVMVWGENVLPAFADAVVAIDQATSIAIDVQRGVRTEVHLPGSIGMMTVHFADGSVVREIVFEQRSWVRGFAPGDYRVEYDNFNGERQEASFTVGNAPGDPIELTLARTR